MDASHIDWPGILLTILAIAGAVVMRWQHSRIARLEVLLGIDLDGDGHIGDAATPPAQAPPNIGRHLDTADRLSERARRLRERIGSRAPLLLACALAPLLTNCGGQLVRADLTEAWAIGDVQTSGGAVWDGESTFGDFSALGVLEAGASGELCISTGIRRVCVPATVLIKVLGDTGEGVTLRVCWDGAGLVIGCRDVPLAEVTP